MLLLGQSKLPITKSSRNLPTCKGAQLEAISFVFNYLSGLEQVFLVSLM